MAKKVYSRIAEIPKGSAGSRIVDGCLVLEGGAFRGLYTQGFLDVLMEKDINIQTVIGVSAGALGGMNYVAGQIGRSARINLGYRYDGRYVGFRAMVHSRSIVDLGFLTEERGIIEPLDSARFMDPRRRFIAVTSNCLSGHTACFEKGNCPDILKATRASASMPFVSPMVRIGNSYYLDGGCTCKIAYRWALRENFEKIIVIRTREPEFRKPEREIGAALQFYHKYPVFAKKFAHSNIDYNRQCEDIERLHREGRLLRFAPSEHVTVSRLERDLEKLGDLYFLGRKDAEEGLDTIRQYLNV